MFLLKYIKKNWNDFAARLAKENEKTFNGGKPDCCKLNKRKPAGKGG